MQKEIVKNVNEINDICGQIYSSLRAVLSQVVISSILQLRNISYIFWYIPTRALNVMALIPTANTGFNKWGKMSFATVASAADCDNKLFLEESV
jgi:hypothetical protein